MSLSKIVDNLIRQATQRSPEFGNSELGDLLRLLAKWRHQLISNTIIAQHGNVVQTGPFAGLNFIGQPSEGCSAPRLLGCYEQELHEHIERLIKIGFESVLNIGCADGYYAIGLAKRIPSARIFAHDISEKAQASCRAVAEINEVSDRVEVGGLFRGIDYERFSGSKTWLLMDIEGGERELLDPCSYPLLRAMTILVECHDCFIPGLANEIAGRFAHTHSVVRVDHSLAAPTLPEWLQGLGHLDQLLATWEWRIGPTPWLVMEPH